jgi:hypothetical protein
MVEFWCSMKFLEISAWQYGIVKGKRAYAYGHKGRDDRGRQAHRFGEDEMI